MTYRIPTEVQEKLKAFRNLEVQDSSYHNRLENEKQSASSPNSLQNIRTLFEDMLLHYKKKQDILIYVLAMLDQIMESVGNRDRPPTMDNGPGMTLPPPPREEFFFQPKTKVCAKVQGKVVGGEFGMWIYASVLGYHPKAKKYEIVDEDIQDVGDEKKKYKIHRKWVQPLPANWESRPNVKTGDLCFAMFPETTSFYLARVIQVAKTENQFYQLKFEDDEVEEGVTPPRKVSYRFVISLPREILRMRNEMDKK